MKSLSNLIFKKGILIHIFFIFVFKNTLLKNNFIDLKLLVLTSDTKLYSTKCYGLFQTTFSLAGDFQNTCKQDLGVVSILPVFSTSA